jgi:hypothetical protein
MDSLELKFYEHASVPAGAAWFICRDDDPRLTGELRAVAQFPCIVTDDLLLLKQTLTLLRIAELWEEAAPYHRRGRGR